MLRPMWKCFQFQGIFMVTEDQNAANIKENQHWPSILFHGEDTKPEVYETRNCYPLQDSEVTNYLNLKLDELILGNYEIFP